MVIPVMSGASLTSSVVAKPSTDAVSLPEVLLAAVASEVLSLQPYFPRRMCSPSGFRKRLLRMLWMCCSQKLPKCPTRTMCCFPLMRCCRRPSVTSLLQEKVRPIFSAFFRFFLSFDIPFLKKKPLPYGSSPFSFFAANYCTYLFSSAFTIFWNSSFA